MRVLVGCEESQEICKAFRAKGHEAYSCDLKPSSGGHPEWHIQTDVLNVIYHPHRYGNQPYFPLNNSTWKWDLAIFHPECRYIANSGVCWISKDPTRMQKVIQASAFFYALWRCDIPRICIENPIPHKYAKLHKYSQIIQPWMFGHTERKATCLWLKNLPPLKETNNVKEEMMKLPDNQRQRLYYLPPSKDRAAIRAKTFPGIAAAMADQWGRNA